MCVLPTPQIDVRNTVKLCQSSDEDQIVSFKKLMLELQTTFHILYISIGSVRNMKTEFYYNLNRKFEFSPEMVRLRRTNFLMNRCFAIFVRWFPSEWEKSRKKTLAAKSIWIWYVFSLAFFLRGTIREKSPAYTYLERLTRMDSVWLYFLCLCIKSYGW